MLLFLKYLCCPSKEFQHLENFTNMESHSLLHFAILEKCFCVIQMNDWTQLYYFFSLVFLIAKEVGSTKCKIPQASFSDFPFRMQPGEEWLPGSWQRACSQHKRLKNSPNQSSCIIKASKASCSVERCELSSTSEFNPRAF